VIWAAIWLGMAALWLLPANDGPMAVGSLLQSAAGSSPSWLAHFQRGLAGTFHGDGRSVAIALALLSLVIGIGPLLARRATVFLIGGAALALDYWVLGQSFGGIVTGIATDPNAGPLLILLAAALFPNDAPKLHASSSQLLNRPTHVPDSVANDERILMPV